MYFVHPQIRLDKLRKTNLQQKLAGVFPQKQIVFTDMGRSAFKIVVEKLGLANSEILMPAYICDIFRPILEKYNIKPVFLDIDLRTFEVRPEEIERKITPQTRAIFICHTYGRVFDVASIKKFGLPIIEDCAHAFGSGAGLLGDVSFFSLYKQFPALRGGMLVCPKDWQINLPRTSFNFRDFISLLNCFPLFAFLFKKFGSKFGGEIAAKMVRKEKLPEPAGLNKLSLALFSYSLDNFEKTLPHRIELAKFFQKELQNLGFSVQDGIKNVFCYLSALTPEALAEKRDKIVEELRKHGVFCTRIWHTPVVMDKENFPFTYEASRRVINLPLQNHYQEKDVKKMIKAIKKVLQKV